MARLRSTRPDTGAHDKQYRHKTVHATRGRLDRVADKWHRRGWEFVSLTPGRVHTKIAFRREGQDRLRGKTATQAALVLVLVAGLVVTLSRMPSIDDPLAEVRADSRAAIEALKKRDIVSLDKQLSDNLGQTDFAFFLTSEATPRVLGDALAAVASTSVGARDPFKAGLDTGAYELMLTRLAGTLALATHGSGDQALPKSWTRDFVGSMTTPEQIFSGDDPANERADQDLANKQNLLLLLSRGYWSFGFLKSATAAFWKLDHDRGEEAWPGTTLDDAVYAPAPNGSYLTDGMLALTAALTANPAASAWAFKDFQPGTETVSFDGSEHSIGLFAHYLFFEHKFPSSPGDDDETGSIGMTAVLTALSSAIDASGETAEVLASSEGDGPMADALVLRALADSLADEGGFLSQVWDATKLVAEMVWNLVQRWGHRILDILTFAPPPFGTIAASGNAVWYVVDSDYANAGLSLAAIVPVLAFVKIAKSAKVNATAERTAKKSADVAKAAKASRLKPWNDCDRAATNGGIVVRYGDDWTRAQRRAADEKLRAIWEAAQRGEVRKTTTVKRSGTSATSRYEKSGGKVRKHQEADHTVDLQLGGSDDVSNMKPLDKTVNRSLGIQVRHQLKSFDEGQVVSAVAIC